MKKTGVLVLVLYFFSISLASEEIYKTVDEEGRISFSSSGGDEAERVDVKDANVVTLPKFSPPVEGVKTGPEKYKSLIFTAPEEAVTEIRGKELPYTLNVRVSSEPELQDKFGHRYQFYFDGEVAGKPSSTASIGFKDLHRGSYQVTVAIIDTDNNNKELIRSETIMVNVRQHSAPRPSPR